MDRWRQYLFESHPEDTLRDWAKRLSFFRFVRAYGGHANDGDSLNVAYRCQSIEELERFFRYLEIPLVHFAERPAQPEIGISYPGDEFAKFASLIPGTRWIEQPGHCSIANHKVFASCEQDRIRISLDDDYRVTESHVKAAEAIEKVLLGAPLARIDPPIDNEHCICPTYYPDYFG
jgi:hypothetical protein